MHATWCQFRRRHERGSPSRLFHSATGPAQLLRSNFVVRPLVFRGCSCRGAFAARAATAAATRTTSGPSVERGLEPHRAAPTAVAVVVQGHGHSVSRVQVRSIKRASRISHSIGRAKGVWRSIAVVNDRWVCMPSYWPSWEHCDVPWGVGRLRCSHCLRECGGDRGIVFRTAPMM